MGGAEGEGEAGSPLSRDLYGYHLKSKKSTFIFLKILREREREQGGETEGEAGSLLSGEPDTGLDPITP